MPPPCTRSSWQPSSRLHPHLPEAQVGAFRTLYRHTSWLRLGSRLPRSHSEQPLLHLHLGTLVRSRPTESNGLFSSSDPFRPILPMRFLHSPFSCAGVWVTTLCVLLAPPFTLPAAALLPVLALASAVDKGILGNRFRKSTFLAYLIVSIVRLCDLWEITEFGPA